MAMDKAVKKAFIRYTKKKYPDEAEQIIRRADALFPQLCAKANGYTDLLPHLCATDHVIPKLMHAKLIRTHTCALGSDSCDYWYVGDESETARHFKGKSV